jgi:chromate transporter
MGANVGLPRIFLTFCKIGLLLFGGGNVILPVAQKYLRFTQEELCEFYALARSMPGIVAPNFAVLTGYKMAGIGGAVLALLGLILPSFVMIVAVAAGFEKVIHLQFVQSIFWGVGIGVVMLIFMGVNEIWDSSVKGRLAFILFFTAFILSAGFRMPPAAIVLMAVAFGIATQLRAEAKT